MSLLQLQHGATSSRAAPRHHFGSSDAPAGFLAALLRRKGLVSALQVGDAAVADASLAAALDLAAEAGLNRPGLQRLLEGGATDAAATLQQHARLAQ